MKEHPITPSDELIEQWLYDGQVESSYTKHIATQAARWGADQELEACCDWLLGSAPWTVSPHERPEWIDCLLATRRPKPPTLKERGRKALQSIHNAVVMETGGRELDVLKEIVESLPD